MFLLSFVAIWGAFNLASWPEQWLLLLEFAPIVIGVIGAFIGFWLNRLRPFLVLSSILLLGVILAYYAPVSEESISSSVLFPILSFLLPFNIFLWTFLPEKGTQNARINTFVIAITLLQGVFVYWFMYGMELERVLSLSKPVFTGIDFYHLPFASSLMFVIAGLLLSWRVQNQRVLQVFEHAVLFGLLLMGFAINQYLQAGVIQWVASIVLLMVIFALILDAHHIAYSDELTNISNRRSLNEALLGLGKRYTIAMVDIDYFKQFNDTYGHDLGDQVLQMVAGVLNEVEVGGRAYRFGGEEFTIVFKNKQIKEVKQELESLRVAIEQEIIQVVDAKTAKKPKKEQKIKEINVTVSMGVAESQGKQSQPSDVIKQADELLYKAKKTGRNKVVFASK